jgi:hypothetical protein
MQTASQIAAKGKRFAAGSTTRITPEEIRAHIRETRLRPDNTMPPRYRWLWELALSDLQEGAEWNAVAIWLFTDQDGEGARPSQSTFAALGRCDSRTTRRHTRQLEEAGLLGGRA